MIIEKRFLQEAIKNKNYISFTYNNKKYTKIEPLELISKDPCILKTSTENFEFELIKKIIILKDKF